MGRATRALWLVAACCAVPATASAQEGAGLRLAEPMAAAPIEATQARESTFAMRSRFSLFAQAGLALSLHGPEPSPTFLPNMGVAFQLTEHLGLGVRSFRFGVMGSTAGQTSVQGGANVYLEPSVFVDPRVQLYAQLGVTVNGGTTWTDGSPFADVDLTVRAGVRFWVTDWMTIAVEAGFDLRLTEPSTPYSLEQGTLTPYIGLTVGFHF